MTSTAVTRSLMRTMRGATSSSLTRPSRPSCPVPASSAASFSKSGRRAFSSGSGGGGAGEPSMQQRFWTWTTQKRPSWKEDKVEAAVIFTVFGITGSSSVALVRPALKHTIGLEGTMMDGPWSYRIGSILAVSPVYACVLLTVGTVAGRHTFFSMMATKIFGRFLPSSLSKWIACPPALVKRSADVAKSAGEKLTK